VFDDLKARRLEVPRGGREVEYDGRAERADVDADQGYSSG
jgi:hypothetical protein